MTRRGRIVMLVVAWLIMLGLLGAAIVLFAGTRLSTRTGFPHMPLYGAVTWWFFLSIPLIGLTYGALNEWRNKDR